MGNGMGSTGMRIRSMGIRSTGMGKAEVEYIDFTEATGKWNIGKLWWEKGEEGYIGFGEVMKKWSIWRLCLEKKREESIHGYWGGFRKVD